MANKRINILALSLFGRKGASSRYRLYQYIPFLENKNIFCCIYPLIGDNAYDVLLDIKRINPAVKPFIKFYYAASALIKRFFQILSAGSYDLVYIQKDVLPAPYLFILKKLNSKIIFDLDDALYEKHATIKPSVFSIDNLFFKFRKTNLDIMLKSAKAVTVTTPYLAEYVKLFSQNVHVITGPINIDVYKPAKPDDPNKTVIGWIGSPVTTKYVQDMMPIFKELQKKHPKTEIHLIGAKKFDAENLNIKFSDWSEDNEIELLSDFNIGIMPLTDDKWSKGKGGLKLLQYFAMSIPVVCSPVGINNDIVLEGKNGFFAKNEKEWIEKLSILIENENLRRDFGSAGHKLVEQKFDLKKSVDYIEDIIRKTV